MDELCLLEADGIDKILLGDENLEVLMSLFQHTNTHNYEQDGSSVDLYCECESCNGTVSELQNALAEVVTTVLTRHVKYERKKLPL